MQKVDLLAAARCNLFSYSLANYHTNWISICQNNVDVLQTNIKSIEPAKHVFGGVLKDLGEADDRKELKPEKTSKKEKAKSQKGGKKSDTNLFFGVNSFNAIIKNLSFSQTIENILGGIFRSTFFGGRPE